MTAIPRRQARPAPRRGQALFLQYEGAPVRLDPNFALRCERPSSRRGNRALRGLLAQLRAGMAARPPAIPAARARAGRNGRGEAADRGNPAAAPAAAGRRTAEAAVRGAWAAPRRKAAMHPEQSAGTGWADGWEGRTGGGDALTHAATRFN